MLDLLTFHSDSPPERPHSYIMTSSRLKRSLLLYPLRIPTTPVPVEAVHVCSYPIKVPSMSRLVDIKQVIPTSELSDHTKGLIEQTCQELYDEKARPRPDGVDDILADLKRHLFAEYTKCLSASSNIQEKLKHLDLEHCKLELERLCLYALRLDSGNLLFDRTYVRVLLNTCLLKRASVFYDVKARQLSRDASRKHCELSAWHMRDELVELEFTMLERSRSRFSVTVRRSCLSSLVGSEIHFHLL